MFESDQENHRTDFIFYPSGQRRTASWSWYPDADMLNSMLFSLCLCIDWSQVSIPLVSLLEIRSLIFGTTYGCPLATLLPSLCSSEGWSYDKVWTNEEWEEVLSATSRSLNINPLYLDLLFLMDGKWQLTNHNEPYEFLSYATSIRLLSSGIAHERKINHFFKTMYTLVSLL